MKSLERKIQIYPAIEGVHTVHNSLIANPPKGYRFIGTALPRKLKLIDRVRDNKFFRRLYRVFLNFSPNTGLFDLANRSEILDEAELVYSTGYLIETKKPWILEILDVPYCLTGYNYELFVKNKERIESILRSDNCRKIICTNESSIEIMRRNFSEVIIRKTSLVRPALELPEFGGRGRGRGGRGGEIGGREGEMGGRGGGKVKILFMGSINNPKDFYVKGGFEALRVFERIQEKHDVELVIRCYVPNEVRSRVLKNKKTKLIENKISSEELKELYSQSDIALLPSHQYVLMAFLESMSFGLPIVALDTYAVKNYIIDGYNGFVVGKSDKISSYKYAGYPTNTKRDEFLSEIKVEDSELIERLAEKVELLIKDRVLREKIGRNGRKIVKSKFSVEERNRKLKKIFDGALV